MAGITNVRFVDFEIKEDVIEQGALEIVKTIRPHWKIDDIKFKVGRLLGYVVLFVLSCETCRVLGNLI